MRSLADPEAAPNDQELISEPPPYHLRIAYSISVWSFKAAITLGLGARRLFLPRPPDLLPSEERIYPIRPNLRNVIYRPEGSGHIPLPVYFNIHGGGWAVADPPSDEEFCSFLARTFNVIVVSVDYHLSPTWKFPVAVEDVAAIADATLNDKSLNIDSEKVAMGGFSAGGNLAFAACQLSVLKGCVHGMVGFYPPLDMTETLEEKIERRPKKAGTDALASSGKFLDWAYVPEGADRRNPLLSPAFAKKEDLPRYVYLVGGEYDMLCFEGNRLAEQLAEPRAPRNAVSGLDVQDGWKQGRIRWECARGRSHAFTHVAEWNIQKEKDRVKFVDELYHRVGAWLKEEVWADQELD